jgi:Cu2+-exporting ATPase
VIAPERPRSTLPPPPKVGTADAKTTTVSTPSIPVCAHCHLAVLPGDDSHTEGDRLFCCAGCLAARRVIDQLGLGRFDAMGGAPGPVAAVVADDADLAALSDAVGRARSTSALTNSACRLTVDVDGVSCASCAWLVEKVAGKSAGVDNAVLNPARGTLELLIADGFDPAVLSQALSSVGHRVRPAGTSSAALASSTAAADDLLFRLGISSALAMAAMIASFSLFLGLSPDDRFGRLFQGLAGVSSLIVVLVGGWPFVRGAIASVRRGAPTMDLPIAVGMVAAWTASLLASRQGAIVSFDTVAIFVTLMLAGRLVERRLVLRHRQLLTRRDDEVAGLRVRRIDADGQLRFVTVKDIGIGDTLHLARGELVPTDATLLADAADSDGRLLSFAWLTGESQPHTLLPGAAVVAGAHVIDPRGAVVQATSPFSSTRLSQLLADRGHDTDVDRPVASGIFPWLARVWVVGAFAVAGVGAIVWWNAPTARLLEIVAGLLVVTCPCAFGIAAPLAVERATVLLRQRGVFVRHPRLWWRASQVRHAIFDKTGTLTEDEPVVDAGSRAGLMGLSARAQSALLATVARSNHGRSRALLRALQSMATAPSATTVVVVEQAGQGLTGTVDGARVVVGRDDGDAGLTRVSVTIDGVTESASIAFAEALRPGAKAAIARLHAAGIDVWVASGDSLARAVDLAALVGVPADHVLGECQPDDKAALVHRLGKEHVLVVGDGVNDAAMFAVAAVCGVPATDRPHLPARADFLLLGSTDSGAFGSVVDVVAVARRLHQALTGLLVVATVYNIAVISMGLMGLLTPLMVALLMPSMSVSLLLLAFALVRLPKPSVTSFPSPSLSATTEVPA